MTAAATARVVMAAAIAVAYLLATQAAAARIDTKFKHSLSSAARRQGAIVAKLHHTIKAAHLPAAARRQGRAVISKLRAAAAASRGKHATKPAALGAPAFCPAWSKCFKDIVTHHVGFTPGMTDSTYPAFAADKCISVLQTIVGAPVTGVYDQGTAQKVVEYGLFETVAYEEWEVAGILAGCM